MDKKRNTVQRQLILNAVEELNIHANAEQVYEHVIKTHPSISKATVYRNLSQMAESGELLNIGSFYGSVHYDHNCHEHYHFICEKCKCIIDVEKDFSDILNGARDDDRFDIAKCHISFSGICQSCVI